MGKIIHVYMRAIFVEFWVQFTFSSLYTHERTIASIVYLLCIT